jgi:hypothetical protein
MDTPLIEGMLRALVGEAKALGWDGGLETRGHDGNNHNLYVDKDGDWHLELHRSVGVEEVKTGGTGSTALSTDLPTFVEAIRGKLAVEKGANKGWDELRCVAVQEVGGSFGGGRARRIRADARDTLALCLVLEAFGPSSPVSVSVRVYQDMTPDQGAPREWVECRVTAKIEAQLVNKIRKAKTAKSLRALSKKAFGATNGAPIERFLDAFEFRDP